MNYLTLQALNEQIVQCKFCSRLVFHREQIARVKRKAFQMETYWGKPVPGWGDPNAQILIIGLAPGAHGANRTGRIFTGDSSGDFLFSALYRAGYASQPQAASLDDRLVLTNVYITNLVRCAPPSNLPARDEIARCLPYLHNELNLLPTVKLILTLGKVAHQYTLMYLDGEIPRKNQSFLHGEHIIINGYHVFSSYHPSKRNTQTRLLTPTMFDSVLSACKQILQER
jgi:uracil-DNA glycosylase